MVHAARSSPEGRRRLRVAGLLLAVLPSTMLSSGCGRRSVDEAVATATYERMVAVGEVYRAAAAKRRSPPLSAEDLRDCCPAGMTPEALLVSPGDGEPITIFWGTDPTSGMDINPLVLAHEKSGGPTGRYVLTTMGVMLMPAGAFSKARFPDPVPAVPPPNTTKKEKRR